MCKTFQTNPQMLTEKKGMSGWHRPLFQRCISLCTPELLRVHPFKYSCLNHLGVEVCDVPLLASIPLTHTLATLSPFNPQGSCNLAVNLIIQIAEYLMVLKLNLKELYYLFTPDSPDTIQSTSGGPMNAVNLQDILNYWPIICLNPCHSKLNNSQQCAVPVAMWPETSQSFSVYGAVIFMSSCTEGSFHYKVSLSTVCDYMFVKMMFCNAPQSGFNEIQREAYISCYTILVHLTLLFSIKNNTSMITA